MKKRHISFAGLLSFRTCGWVGAAGLFFLAAGVLALPPPASLEPPLPASLEELQQLEAQIRQTVQRVLPATVAVRVGGGQGSGVIISPTGYVLTAGHVAGDAHREATVIFADGKKVRARTLGIDRTADAGLLQLEGNGPWPHVDMGDTQKVKLGQWCLALGHPGGYQPGRPPVVRLGRIVQLTPRFLRTECTLVGGDSGGPLFDLEGRVIGIHSRIGISLTANLHVPVNIFRTDWERLAAGEVWGERKPAGKPRDKAFLGVQGNPEVEPCRIEEVLPDSPAARAGLRPGDILTQLDEQQLNSFADLAAAVARYRPGDRVTLQVQRGRQRLTLSVVLGQWPAGEKEKKE